MTSREAALVACGEEAVRAYELVKTFYTRFGLALERTFADAVEGRRGRRGEPDVVTRLGGFEFCASASSKNSAGRAAERARGAVVVQVSGPLRPGVISGVDFLRRHGVKDAPRVAGQCEVAALNLAKAEAEERVLQLELG